MSLPELFTAAIIIIIFVTVIIKLMLKSKVRIINKV